ncbi:sensor domain-containing diguanylate cyclase [Leeia oryzae]|uniref:sensor domain-containing diguanylate cyclase n=1 Tax=Leeia oryzae TaxID=356662 RepID=UPI00038172D1|nr:sensor domain-containing diguanylate cyclase [Leeia oryzae]
MPNKINWKFLTIVLCLLLLAGGIYNYVRQVSLIRADTEHAFQSRSELLGKFVALHRDQVTVMRNLLADRYAQTATEAAPPLGTKQLPALGVWAVSDSKALGNATVTGDLAFPPTPAMQREIASAIGMTPQIKAALQFNADVVWAYYLSASHFIYLAPQTPVEQFRFSNALYQRSYWQQASPKANPARRMILSGPYQDLAGKGWIMTFAQPVYDGDRFLGVVAIDLRIDTLQQLANVSDALGETMMISEHHHLIARQHGFEPGLHVNPPLTTKLIDWKEDKSSDLWLSSQVVKDELWLVHRVQRNQLYWAAARETRPLWIMIVLMGLVMALSLRLKTALAEVTRLMHVDPLTQALNRRGFFEKADMTLAMAQRKQLTPVVLMMDIDHFKKVNDTFGHDTGDSVLKQVGSYLGKGCRPFDLFCRWGGEEFVLLLMLEGADDAFAVAERLRQEAQRTRIQPGDQPVTLSGGLVRVQTGESVEDAIKRADLLLYDAKHNGRNHIEVEAALRPAT